MTMPGCFKAFGVCAIRVSELDDDGSRICPNVNGSAFDLSPVSFTATAEVTTGETFEQRDGCGRICSVVRTPDETTGYSGSVEICNQDFELVVILGNGSFEVITSGGETIGFKQVSEAPAPVEFNLWQQVYDGNARAAGANAYLRHVLPYTQWNLSDWSAEAGQNTVTMNFTSAASAAIFDGTFEDFAVDMNDALYARWLEGTIPDTADEPYASTVGCGFVDSPSCAAS